MKLYSAPLSLFARKVEIALAEKGLAFERVMVPFTQTEGYRPKHPGVLAANPKGQVPVLEDDGLVLFDSTLILEYLEDAYPAPPLYPATPRERALCRMHELYADEIMLVPIRALMYRTGPRSTDPERRARIREEGLQAEPVIAGHYGEIERRLGERDFLCGDAFTVADIAVFMMVLYALRLAGPPIGGHPRLSAWYARVAARPTVAAVVEEIAAADRALSFPVDAP
jgi:glutathione S-transferase